jgi:hypothetical protein
VPLDWSAALEIGVHVVMIVTKTIQVSTYYIILSFFMQITSFQWLSTLFFTKREISESDLLYNYLLIETINSVE